MAGTLKSNISSNSCYRVIHTVCLALAGNVDVVSCRQEPLKDITCLHYKRETFEETRRINSSSGLKQFFEFSGYFSDFRQVYPEFLTLSNTKISFWISKSHSSSFFEYFFVIHCEGTSISPSSEQLRLLFGVIPSNLISSLTHRSLSSHHTKPKNTSPPPWWP